MVVSLSNINIKFIYYSFFFVFLSFTLPCSYSVGQGIGIWTSSAELATIPMSGRAWEEVLKAANTADSNDATVSNQDSDNNVQILASAIVYARTGNTVYKDKVIAAIERLVFAGKPSSNTLAWARETCAYVMAADLVGYRTSSFSDWLRNIAEDYIALDNRTILEMFLMRPNNWGTMAFGTLSAIYRYLGDDLRLNEIRDYWIQCVIGPKPDFLKYGSNLSWHVDQNNLRWINPVGAVKEGISIDGTQSDDMRRGGSFCVPPLFTSYPWEALQGLVTAARILDRAGLSIWSIGDSAIYRAVNILEVKYAQDFDIKWKAIGDDVWILPFVDAAYGTNLSRNTAEPRRLWNHGKIAGWGYIIVDDGHTNNDEVN